MRDGQGWQAAWALVGTGIRVSALALPMMASLAACGGDDSAGDPCVGVTCSGQGNCQVDPAEEDAYCACWAGFHPGADELTCEANDPAEVCLGVECSGHGTCRPSRGLPQCDCDPGYEPDESGMICLSIPGADADASDVDEAESEAEAETDADTDADVDGSEDADEVADEDGEEDAPDGADVGPRCGDLTVDPGEECDDGNADDTDACVAGCRNATCGDGFLWTGHETCEGTEPATCTTTCASSGTQACVACNWEAACTPPVESCNAVDDDCDTTPDNGFACLSGASVGCTTSCGTAGSGVCTTLCEVPTDAACTVPAEACNAVDDDCDTLPDDGFACVQGTSLACMTSCGTAGTGTCSPTCDPPIGAACTPPAETCNAADDDCDTALDDGFACVRGTSVGCTTTCGSTGSGACSTTCEIPTGAACTPPAETCNGADDDCDTACDDGFGCCRGATRACTVGTCPGTETCSTSCAWGACSLGAPPGGDTCAGSVPDISAGGVFTGSTCAAADDYTYVCGGTTAASPDVLFRLVLPGTRNVVLDTVGTGFDAVLFLRSGTTCPGTAAERCDNDTAGGGQARLEWLNMPAGTYWVVLDGVGAGNRGSYLLNVSVSTPPPPANDTCAGATLLPDSGMFSGSTLAATDTHTPACGAGAGGPDVWFRFTLPAREVVYLDVADGNAWNSILQVRQGSCPTPATSVACQDDSCGGVRSQWYGTLDAGTYYVVLDSTGPAQIGDYSLFYQHVPCGGGSPITGNGDYDGTTVGQGNEYAPAVPCWSTGRADVEYYLGLCASRAVTASTCNSVTGTARFDSLLYFRSGSCTGTQVACADDAAGGACSTWWPASILTATLPKGLSFLIVDGGGAADGAYRVTISGM